MKSRHNFLVFLFFISNFIRIIVAQEPDPPEPGDNPAAVDPVPPGDDAPLDVEEKAYQRSSDEIQFIVRKAEFGLFANLDEYHTSIDKQIIDRLVIFVGTPVMGLCNTQTPMYLTFVESKETKWEIKIVQKWLCAADATDLDYSPDVPIIFAKAGLFEANNYNDNKKAMIFASQTHQADGEELIFEFKFTFDTPPAVIAQASPKNEAHAENTIVVTITKITETQVHYKVINATPSVSIVETVVYIAIMTDTTFAFDNGSFMAIKVDEFSNVPTSSQNINAENCAKKFNQSDVVNYPMIPHQGVATKCGAPSLFFSPNVKNQDLDNTIAVHVIAKKADNSYIEQIDFTCLNGNLIGTRTGVGEAGSAILFIAYDCVRATAVEFDLKEFTQTRTPPKEDTNSSKVTMSLLVTITVVILASVLLIYYFFCRRSSPDDSQDGYPNEQYPPGGDYGQYGYNY